MVISPECLAWQSCAIFLDAFSPDALPLVQEQQEINSKHAGKLENQSQCLQLYFGLVFVHPQSIRLAMVESVALSGNIGNPCWLLSAHPTLTLCPLLALVSTEARLLSSIRGALGHRTASDCSCFLASITLLGLAGNTFPIKKINKWEIGANYSVKRTAFHKKALVGDFFFPCLEELTA